MSSETLNMSALLGRLNVVENHGAGPEAPGTAPDQPDPPGTAPDQSPDQPPDQPDQPPDQPDQPGPPLENNVAPRARRVRRCGFCREAGHDRRTCPAPEEVARRSVATLQRRGALDRLREERIARVRATQQQIRESEERRGIRRMRVHNHNGYEIVLLWSSNGGTTLKYLQRIRQGMAAGIKFGPNCKVVVVPTAELPRRELDDARFRLDRATYQGFIVGEYDLNDHTGDQLYIISEQDYTPKSDLDQWKECGLKSLFLLNQLDRLGATKYDNLEPIMDMVQDIRIPTHTPMDCENAGIPSVLTNVT